MTAQNAALASQPPDFIQHRHRRALDHRHRHRRHGGGRKPEAARDRGGLRPPHARLRPRGAPHRGGVRARHRFPQPHRQATNDRAQRGRPVLRRDRLLDPGLPAQQRPERRHRDGVGTARAVLAHALAARPRTAARSSARRRPGRRCSPICRVADPAGQPIAGVEVDVWQSSPVGLYENQDADQADMNLRGKFTTDADGRFWFRSVKPAGYPVPTDGPVGDLLRAADRGIPTARRTCTSSASSPATRR